MCTVVEMRWCCFNISVHTYVVFLFQNITQGFKNKVLLSDLSVKLLVNVILVYYEIKNMFGMNSKWLAQKNSVFFLFHDEKVDRKYVGKIWNILLCI